ncbi:MAG: hypothetical protein ACKO5J_15500 [Rubrivivax sp.]
MQAAQHLAQALQRELHPPERARLELRLAAIAARQGRFQESAAVVERLRAAQAAGTLPGEASTAAWMHLVQGLAELHRAPETATPDTLARAQALAQLATDAEVQALAAAWLAHLHFNQGRLEDFASWAARARGFAGLGGGCPAALGRVALTVASAWMVAAEEAAAQAWFGCAREAAAAASDSLLVAAVLHDRAAFGVHRMRIGWALAPAEASAPQAGELAWLQLDAARSYEAAVRAQALAELQPLVRIALLVVQERHEEALGWIDQTLPRLAEAGLARYDAQLRADRLWCGLALGRPADALAEATDIQSRLVHTPDPDDRLIVHATLGRALHAAGQARAARAQVRQAALEHTRAQAQWAVLAQALRTHGLDDPAGSGARTHG